MRLIIPLLIIVLIGIVASFFYKFAIIPFIKDITYFIRPILLIFIAYFCVLSISDKSIIVKSIIYLGFFYASIHLLQIFVYVIQSGKFNYLRIRDFGLDNNIEVVSFALLLFYEKFTMIKFSKILRYAMIIVLSISIIFYFSRIMIVFSFILIFSLLGGFKLFGNSIFLPIVLSLILLILIVFTNIDFNRNSKGIEGFLYKIENSITEITNTKIDVSNHKQLWDRWRAYELKRVIIEVNKEKSISTNLFGKGFGSLINLNMKVNLGGTNFRNIPYLHNGYGTIYLKTGIVGVLIYLYFFISLARFQTSNLYHKRLLNGLVLFLLFSSIVINGIYNTSDVVFFISFIFISISLTSSKINFLKQN
ncbi:MAG: hypothetical protein H6604_04375 [Flavobacteriales bacterium]|nr:hypothetical protein [Flavobacteriales bacterium]